MTTEANHQMDKKEDIQFDEDSKWMLTLKMSRHAVPV